MTNALLGRCFVHNNLLRVECWQDVSVLETMERKLMPQHLLHGKEPSIIVGSPQFRLPLLEFILNIMSSRVVGNKHFRLIENQ